MRLQLPMESPFFGYNPDPVWGAGVGVGTCTDAVYALTGAG
jgi:hypothetical protein